MVKNHLKDVQRATKKEFITFNTEPPLWSVLNWKILFHFASKTVANNLNNSTRSWIHLVILLENWYSFVVLNMHTEKKSYFSRAIIHSKLCPIQIARAWCERSRCAIAFMYSNLVFFLLSFFGLSHFEFCSGIYICRNSLLVYSLFFIHNISVHIFCVFP